MIQNIGVDYTYVEGILKIRSDTPITISGETDTDTVVVEKDKDANITLTKLLLDISFPNPCEALSLSP